jgi:hypothetical protein
MMHTCTNKTTYSWTELWLNHTDSGDISYALNRLKFCHANPPNQMMKHCHAHVDCLQRLHFDLGFTVLVFFFSIASAGTA